MAAKTRKRNQVLKGKHGGMQLVLTEDVTHLGSQGDVAQRTKCQQRNFVGKISSQFGH